MPTPLYDEFSVDYDRFINWPKRLARELPFIERQLAGVRAARVLDAACGTGWHAIALTKRGYEVVGVDVSQGMLDRARENARLEGCAIDFVRAGFGELSARGLAGAEQGEFDALLCLGSSLPHIARPDGLAPALRDFARVLRPGGLVLIQNRNFDRVLLEKNRWMPPQTDHQDGVEWVFLRFYDFNADGSIDFNVATWRREQGGGWSQHVASTRLWPLQQAALTTALAAAGFVDVTAWGNLDGAAFEPQRSPNLVVAARKRIQ